MALIQYRKGDIFESNAQVIVNTVNCKGVMGKGLALAFKQRFPRMFEVYREECKIGKLRIGHPTLYRESSPWILNFPTKDNWKANSKLEYLEKGLEYFAANYQSAGIKSVAFPKLGAQNGKLSWDEVGPLMVRYLSKLDLEVSIYIAEGDREYADASNAEASAWMQFNEIAQEINKLREETLLSAKEAKKVVTSRATREFHSLADIHAIEGLAKTSDKRIREYIQRQLYPVNELPGISQGITPHKPRQRAQSSRPKSKAAHRKADSAQTSPLFSPEVTV